MNALHYRLGHLVQRRMHEFLKNVKPNQFNSETRAMLEKIQSKCKECQYFVPKPCFVKVLIKWEEIMLKSEVIIGIMYIQEDVDYILPNC